MSADNLWDPETSAKIAEYKRTRQGREDLERLVRATVQALVKEAELHVSSAKISILADLSAPCRDEPGNWATNRSYATGELQRARDYFEKAEKLLRELGERLPEEPKTWRFKPGEKVRWNQGHPEHKAMAADLGEGPFTVRGVEEGAPEGGQWVSLTNEAGETFVKGTWTKLSGPGYQAAPTTFHSDWLEPVT